jgi:hypothetical protein
MLAVLHFLLAMIFDRFKSRRRLEIENLYLRHQLNIAMRKAPQRLRLSGADRALMARIARLWPDLLSLSRVVQPDTILRWHRAGFRAYWRWKSRGLPGRPRISSELRELISAEEPGKPSGGSPRGATSIANRFENPRDAISSRSLAARSQARWKHSETADRTS